MKKEELFEAIGEVEEEYILEADTERKLEKKPEKKQKSKKGLVAILSTVAALFAVSIILPNVNGQIAYAMSNIPVIGGYFEVMTFRTYEYDTERYHADIDVPQLVTEEDVQSDDTTQADDTAQAGETPQSAVAEQTQRTAEEINADIQKLTEELITEFEAEVKGDPQEEGYADLTVSHEVLVDNESWYTLKLTVQQAAGSGYEYSKFYTIDRTTGKLADLGDIFGADSDYLTKISENIKEQMKEQMAEDESLTYWVDYEEVPEWNFEGISAEQKFYVNQDDQVVICFDEGEVAPMYMGSVTFVIPKEVTDPLLAK